MFYLALGYFLSCSRTGGAQFAAVAFGVGAAVALSYPALRACRAAVAPPRQRVVLFVCDASRAARAECLVRAMTATAHAILEDAGVIPHRRRCRTPFAASLGDPRHGAWPAQQAVRMRLPERFP